MSQRVSQNFCRFAIARACICLCTSCGTRFFGAGNWGRDLRRDLRRDMMQSSVGGSSSSSSLGDKLVENYTGLLPVLWKAVVRWKERSRYEKLGEAPWRHQAHGNMQRLLDGHYFKETTMEGDHRLQRDV